MSDAGIPARTVERALLDREQALRAGIRPTPGIVLVDEAGTIGTRTLARLAEAVALADAKLVLVGDDAQLPPVPAGAGYANLLDHQRQVHSLETPRRFLTPTGEPDLAEAHALAGLRAGTLEGATAYLRHKHETGTLAALDRTTALEAAATWHAEQVASGVDPAQIALIARSNRLRALLNERARDSMRASGLLGPDIHGIAPVPLAVGDVVVCRRNDARLDVTNGTRGRITNINRHELTLAMTDKRSLVIPRAYARAGAVEHAYAITGHLAQAATFEAAMVVTPPHHHTQQWSYTALSRSRTPTQIVVLTEAARDLPAEHALPVDAVDPRDSLRQLANCMTRDEARRRTPALFAQSHRAREHTLSDALVVTAIPTRNERRRSRRATGLGAPPAYAPAMPERSPKLPDGIDRLPSDRYRARVWDRKAGRRVSRTFATLAEARAYRNRVQAVVDRGVRVSGTNQTLHEAAEALIAGMESGGIRTPAGDVYRPSVIRGYRQALRDYLLRDLGALKLSRIERRHVQRIVDELLAQGRDPSTIRNAIKPLAVIFRRAVEDGDLAVNPTERLRLPIARGRRERIAAPEEAVRLISALPASERALWAAAFYAGLRLGELRALEWRNVRLEAGEIRVERNMDGSGVIIPPKSRAGRRVVPIIRRLRDEIVLHQLAASSGKGLVFGSTPSTPFVPNTAYRRARRAWAAVGLEPIGLHEARHTFASYMIAAGTNLKSITEIMGHASVTVSIDRYGHMMPGGREEVVERLDAYLRRSLGD